MRRCFDVRGGKAMSQLLDRLAGCSLEEKAELCQALLRDLIADSEEIRLMPIRSATGRVMGYYLVTEDDGQTEIDVSEGITELSDPEGLVPIDEVLGDSATEPSKSSPEDPAQVEAK
jgi:hypothetical protein